MSRTLRTLLAVSILLLVLGWPVLLYLIFLFNSSSGIGCFGSLFPSQTQIEERTLVTFPPSVSDLQWRCYADLEVASIVMRFKIASSDLERLLQDTPGYNDWYSAASMLQPFLESFKSFDGSPRQAEDLKTFRTWQGNTSCGWTNNLADMDDPGIYTIYVVYSDIEHCELYAQMATHFAAEATQTVTPSNS